MSNEERDETENSLMAGTISASPDEIAKPVLEAPVAAPPVVETVTDEDNDCDDDSADSRSHLSASTGDSSNETGIDNDDNGSLLSQNCFEKNYEAGLPLYTITEEQVQVSTGDWKKAPEFGLPLEYRRQPVFASISFDRFGYERHNDCLIKLEYRPDVKLLFNCCVQVIMSLEGQTFIEKDLKFADRRNVYEIWTRCRSCISEMKGLVKSGHNDISSAVSFPRISRNMATAHCPLKIGFEWNRRVHKSESPDFEWITNVLLRLDLPMKSDDKYDVLEHLEDRANERADKVSPPNGFWVPRTPNDWTEYKAELDGSDEQPKAKKFHGTTKDFREKAVSKRDEDKSAFRKIHDCINVRLNRLEDEKRLTNEFDFGKYFWILDYLHPKKANKFHRYENVKKRRRTRAQKTFIKLLFSRKELQEQLIATPNYKAALTACKSLVKTFVEMENLQKQLREQDSLIKTRSEETRVELVNVREQLLAMTSEITRLRSELFEVSGQQGQPPDEVRAELRLIRAALDSNRKILPVLMTEAVDQIAEQLRAEFQAKIDQAIAKAIEALRKPEETSQNQANLTHGAATTQHWPSLSTSTAVVVPTTAAEGSSIFSQDTEDKVCNDDELDVVVPSTAIEAAPAAAGLTHSESDDTITTLKNRQQQHQGPSYKLATREQRQHQLSQMTKSELHNVALTEHKHHLSEPAISKLVFLDDYINAILELEYPSYQEAQTPRTSNVSKKKEATCHHSTSPRAAMTTAAAPTTAVARTVENDGTGQENNDVVNFTSNQVDSSDDEFPTIDNDDYDDDHDDDGEDGDDDDTDQEHEEEERSNANLDETATSVQFSKSRSLRATAEASDADSISYAARELHTIDDDSSKDSEDTSDSQPESTSILNQRYEDRTDDSNSNSNLATGSSSSDASQDMPQSNRHSGAARAMYAIDDNNSEDSNETEHESTPAPSHRSESESDTEYICKVFEDLKQKYDGNIHDVPLKCFKDAFRVPSLQTACGKQKQFLKDLVEFLGTKETGFLVDQEGKLHRKCVEFIYRLAHSNLFYVNSKTYLTEIQSTVRMGSERAAVTISVLFQSEGLALDTIDRETGKDNGYRFDKGIRDDKRPWSVPKQRLTPNLDYIDESMAKILYGDHWQKVTDHWTDWDGTLSARTKQLIETGLQGVGNKKVKTKKGKKKTPSPTKAKKKRRSSNYRKRR